MAEEDEYIPIEKLEDEVNYRAQKGYKQEKKDNYKTALKGAGQVAGNVLRATGRGLAATGRGIYKGLQVVGATARKSGIGKQKHGFGTKNFGLKLDKPFLNDAPNVFERNKKQGFDWGFGNLGKAPKPKTKTVYRTRYVEVVKPKRRR